MMEDERDKINGQLQGAIDQLRTDIVKVELWASALTVFSKPVPEYDIDQQIAQSPHALAKPATAPKDE